MSSGEVAALAAGVVAGAALVLLLLTLLRVLRAVRELREAVEQLRGETRLVVADLQHAAEVADAELARVDALLDTAESVAGTADSASRLAYLAFANPVIKTMALAAGTGRAVRTLRARNG